MKEKEEKRAVAVVKNTKEGEVFLAENAKKEGVKIIKSGLQYKAIIRGFNESGLAWPALRRFAGS